MKRLLLSCIAIALLGLCGVTVLAQDGYEKVAKKGDDKRKDILARNEERRKQILKKYDDFAARILKIDKNFKTVIPVDPSKAENFINQKRTSGHKPQKTAYAYSAESYYLRSQPADSDKVNIVKCVKGTRVLVLSQINIKPTDKDPTAHWCLVKHPSGVQGYMPLNLLSKKPPRRRAESILMEGPVLASFEYDPDNPTAFFMVQHDGSNAAGKSKRMIVQVDSTLNIRALPDRDSDQIGSVINGEVVEVIKYSDNEDEIDGHRGKWANINYRGVVGWVFSKYLRVPEVNEVEDPAELVKGAKFYVKSDLLRVRDEPNEEGTVITSIPHQKKVVITEVIEDLQTIGKVQSKWVRVDYEAYSGWVFGGFLTKNKNAIVEGDEINQQFIFPVDGYRHISSNFGYRPSPIGGNAGKREYHSGVDIPAAQGTPILATADGQVIVAVSENSGYGNYTILEHSNGYRSLYAHQYQIKVQMNQKVKSGEVIGLVGSTGRSTGPHLHFEIRMGEQALDPMKYIHAFVQEIVDGLVAAVSSFISGLS